MTVLPWQIAERKQVFNFIWSVYIYLISSILFIYFINNWLIKVAIEANYTLESNL